MEYENPEKISKCMSTTAVADYRDRCRVQSSHDPQFQKEICSQMEEHRRWKEDRKHSSSARE